MNILIHQNKYKITWNKSGGVNSGENASENTGEQQNKGSKLENPFDALKNFAFNPETMINALGGSVIGAIIALIMNLSGKDTSVMSSALMGGIGGLAMNLLPDNLQLSNLPGVSNLKNFVSGDSGLDAASDAEHITPIDDSPKFDSPVDRGINITSGYGQRWGRMHNGLDFGTPEGTELKAGKAGRVIYAGLQNNGDKGYGYHVIMEHKNSKGEYTYTMMAHLLANDPTYGIGKIKKGMVFKKGETIAKSGGAKGVAGSGTSTGPHLHFEVTKPGPKIRDHSGYYALARENPIHVCNIHNGPA